MGNPGPASGISLVRFVIVVLCICIHIHLNAQISRDLPEKFESLKPNAKWLSEMQMSGMNKDSVLNTRLDSLQVRKFFLHWLRFKEEQSYPFAWIKLNKDSASVWSILSEDGPRIVLDTLIVRSSQTIGKTYMHGLLQYHKNMPYQQSWINRLCERLERDGNYRCVRAPEIEFMKQKARVYVYPEAVPRNQLMLLAGLQTDAAGKSRLTGDASFDLHNLFKRGIRLNGYWRSPQAMQQETELNLTYPYMIFGRIGVNAGFSILRTDSTCVMQEWKGAILLPESEYGQWSITLRQRGAKEQRGTERLTSNTWLYGIAFQAKNWNAGGEMGKRSAGDQQALTISLRTDSRHKFALNTWSSLYMKTKLEWNYLKGAVWNQADIRYWGGSNSIRGFYDLSLKAESFAGIQSDLHLILDSHLHIPFFLDLAFLENEKRWKSYHGWGTGIYLVQKQGDIGLYYALGQKWGDSVDWKAYKIHLRYARYF